MEKSKCCICGRLILDGYGNNPYPLRKSGRCCDDCNNLVIQARIENIIKNRSKN